MAKVAFSLVMPERELASTEADMVIVPGGDGDFGVLPGHIPMISTVRPGVIEVQDGGKTTARYMVAGGFAEVTRERCTVLAEEAQPFAEVSAEQLARRLRDAQEKPGRGVGLGASGGGKGGGCGARPAARLRLLRRPLNAVQWKYPRCRAG